MNKQKTHISRSRETTFVFSRTLRAENRKIFHLVERSAKLRTEASLNDRATNSKYPSLTPKWDASFENGHCSAKKTAEWPDPEQPERSAQFRVGQIRSLSIIVEKRYSMLLPTDHVALPGRVIGLDYQGRTRAVCPALLPVSERLRTVHVMPAPPNDIVRAFITRCLGGFRPSSMLHPI